MRIAAMMTLLLACRLSGASESVDELLDRGYTAWNVTPVFSQIIAIRHQREFVPALEKSAGPDYLQSHVLKGETLEQWTQMISVSGIRGAAADARYTPTALLQAIAASGFRNRCPESFAGKGLGRLDINGHEASAALMGCGTLPGTVPYSEVAFIVAIRGAADLYTIQWAERGPASSQPPVFDEAAWKARYQKLSPIRICNRVPDEGPPFPSCTTPTAGK